MPWSSRHNIDPSGQVNERLWLTQMCEVLCMLSSQPANA